MTKAAMDGQLVANLGLSQQISQTATNGDFLSQLAKFGIKSVQNSLQALTSSLQSNQALQASVLVGRKVLIASANFSYIQGINAKIMIDIPSKVQEMEVRIFSAAGELIQVQSIGKLQTGLYPFLWTGKNEHNETYPTGKYRIEASVLASKKQIHLTTLITANIDSVSLGQHGEGLKLNVSGMGQMTLDQVQQISL